MKKLAYGGSISYSICDKSYLGATFFPLTTTQRLGSNGAPGVVADNRLTNQQCLVIDRSSQDVRDLSFYGLVLKIGIGFNQIQLYAQRQSFESHQPTVQPIVSISNLSKTYANGHKALSEVYLDIMPGEILALLGPNGAGKTTLISIICGIVNASTGSVTVNGHDIIADYRAARELIGLVPQELTLGSFDTVWNTLNFSRGLFGKKPDPAYIERLLKDLSLWEKRTSKLMTLSGGMKRRVLIGKALSHQPSVLFLDEPTAGVDVELRKDMWQLVRRLRESGVTIILTTHYIDEAEAIADRVGIIDGGELILVDDKLALMHKLGKRQLVIELEEAVDAVPELLSPWALELSAEGDQLIYTYDPRNMHKGIATLLRAIDNAGLLLKDVHTSQSSLEEIFINLVKGKS